MPYFYNAGPLYFFKNITSSTIARFCGHMGLLPRPLIPLIVYPAKAQEMTMSWLQRLPPASNVTSSALLNARVGPNPLCLELPVRETMWLCHPMEVTPAPPSNRPLATVWLCCSVPPAVPPKPSYAPRRDATLTHQLMQHC
jgi:hypothetical protein